MDTTSKWEFSVIKQLTTTNSYGITQIRDFKTVKDLYFNKSIYPNIVDLIRANNLKTIEELDGREKKEFGEYLSIVTFVDQKDNKFAATIYDNDELWQDPEIIEIFKL